MGWFSYIAKQYAGIILKQDFASLSLKAINKILPYLRQGLIYSHAVFLANMQDVLPLEIWKDAENKKIIQNAIFEIIKTQNDEKKIVDTVNAIIQNCRKNNERWSQEASDIYKREIEDRLKKEFSIDVYNVLSEEKKNTYVNNAYDLFKNAIVKNFDKGDFVQVKRIDERVRDFLIDNFEADKESLEIL